MEIVILVGGKGKRLKSYTKRSKTILKVGHLTLLEIIIKLSQKYNFNKINVVCNKKQEDISKFIKKKKLNVNLLKENKYLGDGNGLSILKRIKNHKNQQFLIIYGDLLVNLNLKKILKFHLIRKSHLTLVTHPNLHLNDSDLVDFDKNGKLIKFYPKPQKKIKSIQALSGVYLISGKLLSFFHDKNKKDFVKKILPKIIQKKKNIYCYETAEFIMDTGTKKRLIQSRRIVNKNSFLKANSDIKKPAIFLDRDGVINKEFINKKYQNPNLLIKGTAQALKKIKDKNYLIIVITNQPAIAKGLLSFQKLENLHLQMQILFLKNKTFVDKIYYCPHYPEKGFKREIKNLKIKCDCRKPGNKLVLNAINDYNIDIKKSFFIGNSLEDYLCAKKSKINFIKVGNKKFEHKGKSFHNLNAAVNKILN